MQVYSEQFSVFISVEAPATRHPLLKVAGALKRGENETRSEFRYGIPAPVSRHPQRFSVSERAGFRFIFCRGWVVLF